MRAIHLKLQVTSQIQGLPHFKHSDIKGIPASASHEPSVGLQIQRLPTFFKHRDNNFFPTWTYILPISITRIPASLLEATIFTLVSYFAVPLSIDAGR